MVVVAANSWPTWQQAWAVTVLCVVVAAGLRRVEWGTTGRGVESVVRELAVLTALYGLWRTAKRLPLVQADGAIDRARSIVDLQSTLRLPSELTLNELAVDHGAVGWSSSAYYAGLHVPATLAFLAWMFWRHRDHYGRWRNVLALTTLGCLIIRFWRVAPPRFLDDMGFVDVTVDHGMDVYGAVGTGVSGQFVAMPSIHVAWAAVVAFGVAASSTSRWRWLFVAHLPVTVFVVTATGHHWWLDGAVALVVVGLAMTFDRHARVWVARRILQRRPRAHGGAENAPLPFGSSSGVLDVSHVGDDAGLPGVAPREPV